MIPEKENGPLSGLKIMWQLINNVEDTPHLNMAALSIQRERELCVFAIENN